MSRTKANTLFSQLSITQNLNRPPIYKIWCAAGPSRPYSSSTKSSCVDLNISILRVSRKARIDPRRSYIRLQSSNTPRPAPDALRIGGQKDQIGSSERSEEEQRAYDRLRPIISSLPGPIDWAVAYGSGVRHQANADPSGKPPMTDFLLSTPSLLEFHNSNLRQNPSHYPLIARLLGGEIIAWLTDHWGAGVWYVTMVNIGGLEVKYGVISTERLKRDLESWETLYVAGRLHKPVLPLITPPDLTIAQSTNLKSALTLSLLLLPQTFSEQDLWTQIAGISYAGDPRMSVPGAEHPDKIANIVKGEGALEGMRALYGGFLQGRSGVKWHDEDMSVKRGGWDRKGRGEEMLEQPKSDDHFASLFMALPATLRTRIRKHYESDSTSTVVPPMDLREERDLWLKVVSGGISSSTLPDASWRKVLLTEVANIIRRPALTQSFKGLFTAGFRKSYVYALAKFRKWLHGRRKSGKI